MVIINNEENKDASSTDKFGSNNNTNVQFSQSIEVGRKPSDNLKKEDFIKIR